MQRPMTTLEVLRAVLNESPPPAAPAPVRSSKALRCARCGSRELPLFLGLYPRWLCTACFSHPLPVSRQRATMEPK